MSADNRSTLIVGDQEVSYGPTGGDVYVFDPETLAIVQIRRAKYGITVRTVPEEEAW